ncbi:uncharacterized protein LOC135821675 [Sycon ciliatum]|uniref:uncharacterized protein LOC135821675 n=1 Tax=Sycon ciliatum TaxID=27933 RepID=UPI0031F69947
MATPPVPQLNRGLGNVQATICRQTCSNLQTPAIPQLMTFHDAQQFCSNTMKARDLLSAPRPPGTPSFKGFAKYVQKKAALNFIKIAGVASEESQYFGCLAHHIRSHVTNGDIKQNPFWISRSSDATGDGHYLASDGNRYPANTRLPFVCEYHRTCNRSCAAEGVKGEVMYIPTRTASNFQEAQLECTRSMLKLPQAVPPFFPLVRCVNELLKDDMGTGAVVWMLRPDTRVAYGSDGQLYDPTKRKLRLVVCSNV